MRNLIRFIDNNSFIFLFLFFEAFAFFLLFSNNQYQQSSFLSATNSFSGNIYERYSNLTDYLSLKEINEDLAEENSRLKSAESKSMYRVFGPNFYIDDTLYQSQYHYSAARIIKHSVNKQNNYISIDIGSNNGVEAGMGVIGPNGVIGVVKNVSHHYSIVLSVLHRDSKTSVRLAKNDYFGSLSWNGKDYRYGQLSEIPNHVKLNIGDQVVSSGFSSTFPPGVQIGEITEFSKPEGENFYSISIAFSTDFKRLSKVYVIKNLFKKELKQLEAEIEDSDD